MAANVPLWLIGAVAAGAAVFIGSKWRKSTGGMMPLPVLSPTDRNVAIELKFQGPGGKPVGIYGEESMATADDFQPYTATEEVDAVQVLQNPDVCVYTLAPKQNAVVLVEAKVNSVKKPFLYQQQRLTATRCYLMHYVVYEKALRALQQTSKRSAEDLLREVLFLHSTGRCGSTLLSKLLDNGPSMVSVSEPDVFSALSIALIENTISERDFLQVARAASWHLAYRFGHHPSGKVARAVALKTRSFVLPHADLLHKAVPEAKSMFLYRDPINTIDSFCVAFLQGGMKWFHSTHLDRLLFSNSTMMTVHVPLLAPLMKDPRFSREAIYKLGVVAPQVMMWLSNMDAALKLQRRNIFDAILRYEELVEHKVDAAIALLEALYPDVAAKMRQQSARQGLELVFLEDAHGSSSVTSGSKFQGVDKGTQFISSDDLPYINQLLNQHEELKSRGFKIPGTLLI